MTRRTPAEAARSGEAVVLPRFVLFAKQPDPPHTARVIAHVELRNGYGATVTYTVRSSRKGGTWWISASLEGLRLSNTLRTTSAAKAALWITAVQTGRISVGEGV